MKKYTQYGEVEVNDNYRNKCSIIVSSCDAYSDLWTPFFNSLFKYWEDCPYPIYLLTEEKECNVQNVVTIKAGKNTNWSDRLITASKELSSERILLILEDFFLRSKVNSSSINDLLDLSLNENIPMLRLIPRPSPDLNNKIYDGLGLINPGSKFRVSTQSAIWDKDVLLDLLEPDESIWEFEHKGSIRSQKYENFYSVFKPVLTYRHHVVERGKWFPWEALYFSMKDLGVDLSSRKVMNIFETIRWLMQKTLGPIANSLPQSVRSFLKPVLKKLRLID